VARDKQRPKGPESGECHFLWNYDEVLQVLCNYNDVVKAYFSGHYHPGFYTQRNGIHLYSIKSILECPDDTNSFAIVDVMSNGIKITGFGIADNLDVKW